MELRQGLLLDQPMPPLSHTPGPWEGLMFSQSVTNLHTSVLDLKRKKQMVRS